MESPVRYSTHACTVASVHQSVSPQNSFKQVGLQVNAVLFAVVYWLHPFWIFYVVDQLYCEGRTNEYSHFFFCRVKNDLGMCLHLNVLMLV